VRLQNERAPREVILGIGEGSEEGSGEGCAGLDCSN
jgi:hypothetical protein